MRIRNRLAFFIQFIDEVAMRDQICFVNEEHEDVQGGTDDAPDGAIESMLAGFWMEILDIGNVRRHDNFFHLGGSSLLAVKLVGRIRRQLKVELTPRAIFEKKTLAAIAEMVEDKLVAQMEGVVERPNPFM
jgi:acyl carrier protein